MGKTKKHYAVAKGIKPGIYNAWFGSEGAEEQVRGFSGALYKGFASLTEAQRWLENPASFGRISGKANSLKVPSTRPSPGETAIYTDGGCRGNPGPGGYGVIIVTGEKRIEFADGFRLTTNNRMEMMACIAALRALKTPADVILYSDSRYVVNGIDKGWARKWRANNWMRTKSEAAENSDLWAQLLDLCDSHRVQFVWVPGHAGHPENERCDELATAAAQGADLKEDRAYVQGRTRVSERSLRRED
ncbi:MAG: ribonuclease HI [Syntrophus sp. (in: bacteria)]|nr:ribonuclease HI [Syntrophus sp. (in: bacteria)]